MLDRFLPATLPDNVFVLCATRPKYAALGWLEQRSGLRTIDLDQEPWLANNHSVVGAYWRRSGPQLKPPLDAEMAHLVEEMKSRYHRRIIIFDLPPVLTSADALAFSPYVDAALLVVEEGVSQKHDIEHALELLGGTNVIGTVLNKAEPRVTQ